MLEIVSEYVARLVSISLVRVTRPRALSVFVRTIQIVRNRIATDRKIETFRLEFLFEKLRSTRLTSGRTPGVSSSRRDEFDPSRGRKMLPRDGSE